MSAPLTPDAANPDIELRYACLQLAVSYCAAITPAVTDAQQPCPVKLAETMFSFAKGTADA